MNKPIFDIDAMCSILKRQGIESSERTDCAILYRVTFEQLRSLYTDGFEIGQLGLATKEQLESFRAACVAEHEHQEPFYMVGHEGIWRFTTKTEYEYINPNFFS